MTQTITPTVHDRPYDDLPEATRKHRCEEYFALKALNEELAGALEELIDARDAYSKNGLDNIGRLEAAKDNALVILAKHKAGGK